MERLRGIFSKLLILALAIVLPLGYGISMVGNGPASFSANDLNNWSPFQDAGPTSDYLYDALGFDAPILPDGVTPEDLTRSEKRHFSSMRGLLINNDPKLALGYALILADEMEKRDISDKEIKALIVPYFKYWFAKNYMAPALLGVMGLALLFLIALPWVFREFSLFLILSIGLAIVLGALSGLILLGLKVGTHPGLIFGLIEYLMGACLLLFIGNTLLFIGFIRNIYARIYPTKPSEKSKPPEDAVLPSDVDWKF